VELYDTRKGLGLTAEQKADLAHVGAHGRKHGRGGPGWDPESLEANRFQIVGTGQ
jgi:hypothetical protein